MSNQLTSIITFKMIDSFSGRLMTRVSRATTHEWFELAINKAVEDGEKHGYTVEGITVRQAPTANQEAFAEFWNRIRSSKNYSWQEKYKRLKENFYVTTQILYETEKLKILHRKIAGERKAYLQQAKKEDL